MSLRIEIFLPDDIVSPATLDAHMETLGFDRVGRLVSSTSLSVQMPEAPVTITNTPRAGESAEQTTARERGKPAPGRGRRTKEEIAEDEAAEKADARSTQTLAISTGGERVAPDDDPATEAQDKADEMAEQAGKAADEPVLTVIDGKNALGEYIQKFGIDAAKEDGASIFVAALGPVPTGATGWIWPLIVEQGQDKLNVAVKAWRAAAAAGKRFGAA